VSEADGPRQPDILSIRLIVPLLIVVALGIAVAWWLRPAAEHHPPPAAAPVAKPAVGATPTPVAPSPATAPRTSRSARPDVKPGPAPATVAPATPTLHVSSDVEGAHVFVDRQYVGNTPLETREVTPGRHQVNVSAEGYDGVSENVNVAESGKTDLHVSLKTVTLDASVPVIHKHAMGSCEGMLRADAGGLRYDTENAPDAFSIALSDLEAFSTNYAAKTLKVKKRGGKTWNFTTKAPNADSLVSFQQAVDNARRKIALTK